MQEVKHVMPDRVHAAAQMTVEMKQRWIKAEAGIESSIRDDETREEAEQRCWESVKKRLRNQMKEMLGFSLKDGKSS